MKVIQGGRKDPDNTIAHAVPAPLGWWVTEDSRDKHSTYQFTYRVVSFLLTVDGRPGYLVHDVESLRIVIGDRWADDDPAELAKHDTTYRLTLWHEQDREQDDDAGAGQ